jgi:predicted transcriptional regulator
MARRIYVSDWAFERLKELSERMNLPMYMVVEKAIKTLMNQEKEA